MLQLNGVAITGVNAGNFLNSEINIIKSNGVLTGITVNPGVNFFEIDATAAPGLYHFDIPSAQTSMLGELQLTAVANAGEFDDQLNTFQVEDWSLIEEISRKITESKQSTSPTGVLTVFDDDDTSTLVEYQLKNDIGGNEPDAPSEREKNTDNTGY